MSPNPFYTFPIGDGMNGSWLIRQDASKPGEWLLVMRGPAHDRSEALGSYATPHKAAYAVAHFETGNSMWDATPKLMSAMAEQISRSSLDVLKNWERHD